jgi:uncharacterized protein (TIGR01244 family)
MKSFILSIFAFFGVSMSQAEPHSIVTRHENVWIASQPSEADLDGWAEAGAKMVINSRSNQETQSLPFNLKDAVESRGMQYIEMPIGGPHGADPALTTSLIEILANAEGPVVMHCRSGTRSSHLYAAYLMHQDDNENSPFDTMNWPGGRDMNMVRALTPAAQD